MFALKRTDFHASYSNLEYSHNLPCLMGTFLLNS